MDFRHGLRTASNFLGKKLSSVSINFPGCWLWCAAQKRGLLLPSKTSQVSIFEKVSRHCLKSPFIIPELTSWKGRAGHLTPRFCLKYKFPLLTMKRKLSQCWDNNKNLKRVLFPIQLNLASQSLTQPVKKLLLPHQSLLWNQTYLWRREAALAQASGSGAAALPALLAGASFPWKSGTSWLPGSALQQNISGNILAFRQAQSWCSFICFHFAET